MFRLEALYIYGVSVGCQASATITLTAKSEYEKKELDAAAEASYQGMFSASANFKGHMEAQSSFKDMSVNLFLNGGNVPSIVSTIEEVRDKVLIPLDCGGKCTKENAIVSRVMIRNWLSLQSIADLAQQNPKISEVLLPKYYVSPTVLANLNNVMMKTKTLRENCEKCHANVFSCTTKQWNEPTDKREEYYTQALQQLMAFENKIQHVTEMTLANDQAVFLLEQELENIYLKYIRPAEKLNPFAFHFTITVLNWYDSYRDPPPYGTNGKTGTFIIDPNREDTVNHDVMWHTQPQLDNGHSNCRHFYGKFYASYRANVLKVWQWWNRVCGAQATTNKISYYPGGDTGGTSDYDDTVRTVFSYTVDYNYKQD